MAQETFKNGFYRPKDTKDFISFESFKNSVTFALATILVIVLCWPLLSSITKLIGATMGVANERIKKKEKNKRSKRK